ncbi:uncharacterized protein LOC117345083 [Pecten maximus]|uniref:uncharacterized protein LOC117345083 n=1 Tax=Pecten maximus TaxID=6579 RepID=UPI0014587DCB|nr:uncharacterized protein LOC117345083 [Pecten maximus]
MPKAITCCLCRKRCKINLRRKVTGGPFLKYLKKALCRDICNDDFVCSSCTAKFYKYGKSTRTSNHHVSNVPTSFRSPKTVNLQILSTPRTHKYCIVCQKYGNNRCHLISIPKNARTQAFIEHGIFIDSTNRCCASHIKDKYFDTVSLQLIRSTKTSDLFSRSDITDLLQNVRSLMKTSFHLNFDIPSVLSDANYSELTGLNKDQFADLASYLVSVRNTTVRSTRTCLGVLLVKLKTGLSNELISVLFGLKKSQVQRSVHSARSALIDNFVNKNLGFNHITHDNFCKDHTSSIAKELFTTNNNQAVVVLDGTYIYIQKSGNYKFQRRSYSLHKHRPLVKPMVIVGTDGYILSVLGPYLADGKNNDAAITKHMFANNLQNINQWFNDGDMCIVDRGFRDSVSFLEEHGYRVEMPPYLKKGAKQHTTQDANLSRLVTKVRWIVESVNGRIKQYRMMDKVVPNTYIHCIGDFIQIICSILNKYKKPLLQPTASSEEMARKMLIKSKEENRLLTELEERGLLKKRSTYVTIDASGEELDDFPILTSDDLRDITFGIYQIKQACSYSREHMSDDGDYELLVCKEDTGLLKVRIQSRHCSGVLHSLWIRYDVFTILGWYCTCKVGARVVGCCAHIASVLWYLGIIRHQDTIEPSTKVSSVLDAADMPETDTSDNSDDSESVTEE